MTYKRSLKERISLKEKQRLATLWISQREEQMSILNVAKILLNETAKKGVGAELIDQLVSADGAIDGVIALIKIYNNRDAECLRKKKCLNVVTFAKS